MTTDYVCLNYVKNNTFSSQTPNSSKNIVLKPLGYILDQVNGHWYIIYYIIIRQRYISGALVTECQIDHHLVLCKHRLHFNPKLKKTPVQRKKFNLF